MPVLVGGNSQDSGKVMYVRQALVEESSYAISMRGEN